MKELYKSYPFAFAMTDPSTYDEAVKFVIWREAMVDEIKAIKKVKLGICVNYQKEDKQLG